MGGWNTSAMAWMWRKGPGFTTLSYQGNGNGGLKIAHDLAIIDAFFVLYN